MGAGPSNQDGEAGKPEQARPQDAWADAARARADRLHQRKPAPPPREHKAWFQQLPAKLAGAVVFLVALTTLLGNLLDLREKGRDVLPTTTSAAPVATPAAPVAVPETKPPPPPPGPVRVEVALERIAVQHDGSPGGTDWRFTVAADDQPLLAFEQEDLDDTGGRNVTRPKGIAASLRVRAGSQLRLSVKGWRLGLFRAQGAPDAVGEGMLSPDGSEVAIRVMGREVKAGAFVFYLSADPK